MTIEQHENEVDQLKKLEQELIELIAQTDNGPLITKFLKWQEQRNKCNQGFNDIISSKLKP